jgi:hypothetical protein
MDALWPWLAMAGMGALHGCIAATRGVHAHALQMLLPLAAGHAAAVAWMLAGALGGLALPHALAWALCLVHRAGGTAMVATACRPGAGLLSRLAPARCGARAGTRAGALVPERPGTGAGCCVVGQPRAAGCAGCDGCAPGSHAGGGDGGWHRGGPGPPGRESPCAHDLQRDHARALRVSDRALRPTAPRAPASPPPGSPPSRRCGPTRPTACSTRRSPAWS